MTYPKALKESVLDKMFNSNLSYRQLSEETGIPRATLQQWKKHYKLNDVPNVKGSSAEGWSAEATFAAVLHTATLSEVALNTYCREKGLYPGQIKTWREACVHGNDSQAKLHQRSGQREDKRKIQTLERELQRKEKALAEVAALLVLRKKYDALWEDKEDDSPLFQSGNQ